MQASSRLDRLTTIRFFASVSSWPLLLLSFLLPRDASRTCLPFGSGGALSLSRATSRIRTVLVLLAAPAAGLTGLAVDPALTFVLTEPLA